MIERRLQGAAPHLGENLEQLLKAIPGYNKAAQQASVAIHNLVLGGGEVTRTLADLLHGTWLGHSLHAVLVELPVGSWTAAGLFDALHLATGSRNAAWTADALLALGVGTAVPAAVAGMADYSAIREDAAAEAALHGTLNSIALGLFLLSLADRRNGNRGRGTVTSFAGLGVVVASAWLGGDMVYRRRVGVNFNEPPEQSKGWIAVLNDDELAEGESRRVVIGDDAVMLYRDASGIYAIGAICSHAGGPLEEGTVSDLCVECPWHHSVFSLRDGAVVHGPATVPQASYVTRMVNGLIEVRWLKAGEAPPESVDGQDERSLGA
jgi:nitrite reductase/ring-hydroxylating ferredoxin subunit/uncharacterized membrane protein